MRRPILLAIATAAITLAAAVSAGTRFVDTDGSPPTTATDGVPLTFGTTCRGSVRFADGGTIQGGQLVTHYYDTVVGWTEGAEANRCSLDTSKLLDGGSRRVQVCEWVTAVPFGRAALASRNFVGEDGGAVTAIVRLECWAPQLPDIAGAAQ